MTDRPAVEGEVPLSGMESFIPDTNGPTIKYLAIVQARRAYLRSKTALDNSVWRAHRAGMTNVMIASAFECTEASVRDRLKRIRREKTAVAAELDKL